MGYCLNKPHFCGLSKVKLEEQHLKLLGEPHTTAGRQLTTPMYEDPNRNTPLQNVRAQHSSRLPRAQGQSQELPQPNLQRLQPHSWLHICPSTALGTLHRGLDGCHSKSLSTSKSKALVVS